MLKDLLVSVAVRIAQLFECAVTISQGVVGATTAAQVKVTAVPTCLVDALLARLKGLPGWTGR